MDPDHVTGQIDVLQRCDSREQEVDGVTEQERPPDLAADPVDVRALHRGHHGLIEGDERLQVRSSEAHLEHLLDGLQRGDEDSGTTTDDQEADDRLDGPGNAVASRLALEQKADEGDQTENDRRNLQKFSYDE